MSGLTIQHALDLALKHHQAGRLRAAERLYRQILAQKPGHVSAMNLLGLIARQGGKYEAAIDLFRRAIALAPNYADAHNNLGMTLHERGQSVGQSVEAIAAFRRAIACNPGFPEAHANLGNVLLGQGFVDEAIAALHRAVVLRPTYADAYNNLGTALTRAGRIKDAIAAYRQAIACNSALADAHYNLGNVLIEQPDEAAAAFRQAITLRPGYSHAYNNLALVLANNGWLDDAITTIRHAMVHSATPHKEHSTLAYLLNLHIDYGPGPIARELVKWNRRHAEPLRWRQTYGNDPDPCRRLRIGYVSPDFRDHVVGRNILPLFRRHDRQDFEIFCYAQTPGDDDMVREFQSCADHWRDISALDDKQAANQIHEDRIDLLIDLTLHTAHNRLLIFARKPAPVQATFAGYPGSTGLTAIDYRLSDPYLDPPGMDESIYSEKTIRLPDSFWCYDPLENADIGVNSLPALKSGVVTFGCLNQFGKINDRILSLWGQVLKRTPGSRLILLALPGAHRQRTVDRLARQGIDPRRIEFVSRMLRPAYLELYQQIDVGLDSFPYNGHTTSLDSFWMGVPVVTLVGQTAVSRAGWCQLSNLKLTDLAAHSAEQFVNIAVDLAHDLPRLQHLRSTLRRRMEQSPLMDATAFARNIESAYRQMWQTWAKAADSASSRQSRMGG